MPGVSHITFAKIIGSTPTKSIERVCVSKSSKKQICLLCTEVITDKDVRRKLMISGGQKKTNLSAIARNMIALKPPGYVRRLVWILNWSPDRSGEGSLLTNICAEIAQTKIGYL